MNVNDFARQMSHADVLISQGRFDQAEAILERLLATGYEGNEIMKMMLIAKMGLSKPKEAEELCTLILQRKPDDAFVFYILAVLRSQERKFEEAIKHIREAIRLEPDNANFYAFMAQLLEQSKDFEEAVDWAEKGLNLDPENIDALNARASALVALGRREEAYETINKSLAADPNNSHTHANMGWSMLHYGKTEEALRHFSEALKDNPMNEYAKAGMLEAMKTKFPLYRYFLRVMLWLSHLKGNSQWAYIIGGYIIYRLLVSLSESNPFLQPLLLPVIILIALFFVSSWIFSPLMNLYLLSNNFGKLTLTKEQKESARYVGIALLISIVSVGLYFIFVNEGLITLAILSFMMMIPLGSMNNPFFPKNRSKLRYFTSAILVLVLLESVLVISKNTSMSSMFYLPIISLIAYQWYANYVIIKE
ncbi:MAG: tetratricopeptide repeat protein [Saprospiraceae bacterium]